jgi:hypothetical protein
VPWHLAALAAGQHAVSAGESPGRKPSLLSTGARASPVPMQQQFLQSVPVSKPSCLPLSQRLANPSRGSTDQGAWGTTELASKRQRRRGRPWRELRSAEQKPAGEGTPDRTLRLRTASPASSAAAGRGKASASRMATGMSAFRPLPPEGPDLLGLACSGNFI